MTTIAVSEDVWCGLINERLDSIENNARYIAGRIETMNEYVDNRLKLTEHELETINIYIESISSGQRTIANQADALRKMLDGSAMKSNG